MTITAYPLHWPSGWKRSGAGDQFRSRFGIMRDRARRPLSVADATDRLLHELDLLGVDDLVRATLDGLTRVIVSSNLQLRNDGFPRSNQSEPSDPGVAVYFTLDGEQNCIAIDIYDRVADNIAAIAATVAALRQIERHGGAQILKRAFIGLKQLPAPGSGLTASGVPLEWAWAVLKLHAQVTWTPEMQRQATVEQARDLIRVARKNAHPDRGGKDDDFQVVQRAADDIGAHFGVKL